MQYGIRYNMFGVDKVSEVSTSELAIAIAKSWSRGIYTDAHPVSREIDGEWTPIV